MVLNSDVRIFKMATVAMETEKRRENSKCSKLDETLQKCCLALVVLNSDIGIFKMATVAMETEKRRENSKCSKCDETLHKGCLSWVETEKKQ